MRFRTLGFLAAVGLQLSAWCGRGVEGACTPGPWPAWAHAHGHAPYAMPSMPASSTYGLCDDVISAEISPRFTEDFGISHRISKISWKISRFHEDFKISSKISAEVYEISVSGGPLESIRTHAL